MLDPQREIQALVDNFVADISELARRLAIETLEAAFAATPLETSRAATRTRAGRARRDQRETEALRSKLLVAIAERPGRRTEDLNAVLGTTTTAIAQPLRQLVAEALVRTEGRRRGTRYFAATGEPPHAPGPPPELVAPSDEPPASPPPA